MRKKFVFLFNGAFSYLLIYGSIFWGICHIFYPEIPMSFKIIVLLMLFAISFFSMKHVYDAWHNNK